MDINQTLMEKELVELKKWLDGLNEIPRLADPKQTFFSMTGLQHYENAWSNIYAYFLNPAKEHGLSDSFMRGLEKVIERKLPHKTLNLNYFWVTREKKTRANKRIDMLIQDHKHKIIIENKVYHSLINDLDDYWDSVSGDDDSKTGIVLTLTPIIVHNRHYINITHIEWLEEVRKVLASFPEVSLDNETKIYLEDFMKTVDNLTGLLNQDYLRFYFENREKINILFDISANTKEWLQKAFTEKEFVRNIRSERNAFELVHNNRDGAQYRYAMYKIADTNELVVTVFYEDIWNSLPGQAKLRMFLEPMGDWLQKAIDHKAEIDIITRQEGVYSENKPSSFWHCAVIEEPFSDEELFDLIAIRKKVALMLAPAAPLMRAAGRIIDLFYRENSKTISG